MIIAKGSVYENDRQDEIFARLPDEIDETLASRSLDAGTVIAALDELSRRIKAGRYDDIIAALDMDGAERYKDRAALMMSREFLEYKLRVELGDDAPYTTDPPQNEKRLIVSYRPLGVLLHIAAGNADGLPAFSLAEGLLCGNVNLLKLPRADNGLSVAVINELCAIAPALADFIYVFDTPSTDVAAIMRLASLADGIVTWGGDEAIAAVRRFAAPGARLIEWGHKLGFAYVSGYADKDGELSALAAHVAETKGLLCSSCQTVFIDTDDMAEVEAFCRVFIVYLERAVAACGAGSIGERAAASLRRKSDQIFRIIAGDEKNAVCGAGCELIMREDSELELSPASGSLLVKRLPRDKLIPALRRKKGYLQTAGLICDPSRREYLADALFRAGVVRVTDPGDMSAAFAGESHDGEYALRRYVRAVNLEVRE